MITPPTNQQMLCLFLSNLYLKLRAITPNLEWPRSLPQMPCLWHSQFRNGHLSEAGSISIQAGFISVLLMNLWIWDTDQFLVSTGKSNTEVSVGMYPNMGTRGARRGLSAEKTTGDARGACGDTIPHLPQVLQCCTGILSWLMFLGFYKLAERYG